MLKARLDFVSQENVFHEHLAALNAELNVARQWGLSAEQWTAALSYMVEACDAVALLRIRLKEFARPEPSTLCHRACTASALAPATCQASDQSSPVSGLTRR